MTELSPQCIKHAEDFGGDIQVALDKAKPFIQQYLRLEVNTTSRFRLDIVWYQLGQVMRHLVYKEVAPNSPRSQGAQDFVKSNIGDTFANLLILSEILNIDAGEAVTEAFERLESREWRKS